MLGILGPVVYVLTVGVGGWLWSGYSHYSETISTLTSQGAPNQAILVPLFAFYNLTLIALALGLHSSIAPRRFGALGPAMLASAGAAGLALFLFPQGPANDPLAGTGVSHTVVAGIDALCFLLAMGFLWRRLRSDPRWAPYGAFTAALLVLGILFGGFGAASVAAPWAGLGERLSIGIFLVWTAGMAIGLLVRTAPTAPVGHQAAYSPVGRA